MCRAAAVRHAPPVRVWRRQPQTRLRKARRAHVGALRTAQACARARRRARARAALAAGGPHVVRPGPPRRAGAPAAPGAGARRRAPGAATPFCHHALGPTQPGACAELAACAGTRRARRIRWRHPLADSGMVFRVTHSAGRPGAVQRRPLNRRTCRSWGARATLRRAGLATYGWAAHDGETFGRQELADGRLRLTTSFAKRFCAGCPGGDWALRLARRRGRMGTAARRARRRGRRSSCTLRMRRCA